MSIDNMYKVYSPSTSEYKSIHVHVLKLLPTSLHCLFRTSDSFLQRFDSLLISNLTISSFHFFLLPLHYGAFKKSAMNDHDREEGKFNKERFFSVLVGQSYK